MEKPLTLEDVQGKLKEILEKQRDIAKAKGVADRIEWGIDMMRQTTDFMYKVGELGDSMGISPYQLQDALTLLLAICGGPSPEVLRPGVMDIYVLMLEEKFLANPTARPTGFMQACANA